MLHRRSGPYAAPEQNCPTAPRLLSLPGPSLPQPLADALSTINATAAAFLGPSMPGYALEIWYGDMPLLQASAGLANVSSSLAFAPSTPSRIASVSKLLPSLLLHILADKGIVASLDGRVADACPTMPLLVIDPWEGGGGGLSSPPSPSNITWVHLSSHTGGLQREAPFGSATNPNDTVAMLDAVARTLLIAPPGSRPSYSNLGFALLGHLLAECAVAEAAGVGAEAGTLPTYLPSLVDALISQPLGLQDTQFIVGPDVDPSLLSRMAAGYLPGGTPVPQAALDLGWAYPAGSAVSSARDLSVILRAILAAAEGVGPNPLGLSPAAARRLLDVVWRSPDGSYLQGTPWEVRPRGLNTTAWPGGDASLTGAAPFLVLSKGGNLPGYTALVSLVPELNVSVIALFNGGADEFAFGDALFDILLPPLAAALAQLDPHPAGNPGPRGSTFYTGVYQGQPGAGSVQVAGVPGDGGSMVWVWEEASGGVVSFYLDFVGTVNGSSVKDADGSGAASAVAVDVFQASLPPASELPAGALPCLDDVTLGLRGQFVLFELDAAGTSPATTSMPGFIPGAMFDRGSAAKEKGEGSEAAVARQ
jgi:CubicO group peptidase (beta-lactamase class C family)